MKNERAPNRPPQRIATIAGKVEPAPRGHGVQLRAPLQFDDWLFLGVPLFSVFMMIVRVDAPLVRVIGA